MNEHFVNGFFKVAAPALNEEGKEVEKKYLRRLLLGAPISSAIAAKSGKKWNAFADSYVNSLKNSLGGMGIGAGAGALAGGALGYARGGSGKAKQLAGLLGLIGANIGGLGGAIRGDFGEKATKIHSRGSDEYVKKNK